MKVLIKSTLPPVVQRVDSAIHQAPAVQTLDSAIHPLNHYPADSVILISVILIHWIVIYPVDSAIQRLNNRGQIKHYPLRSAISFPHTCSLDSDLPVG